MRARRRNIIAVAMLAFAASVQAATPTFTGPDRVADGGSQQASAARDQRHESVRSDKFTGGRIEQAKFEAGQPDIKITVDVPAFRLTLWQNGKEVRTYPIGIGMKEFPIIIGEREATEIIWNPSWIPPDSDWVHEMKGVKAGEVIKASDARNPLGKLKIPLGQGYLIHQAAKASDLGNLVSHGCIRMLRSDLYDLAEKIVSARSLPVSRKQIERAKRTSRMLVAKLDAPLPVDINYDTQVVEGGVLYLYPDVYGRGTNTVANLRAELETSDVDASSLSDRTLRQMLGRAGKRQKFAVDVASIEAGRALTGGRTLPVVGQSSPQRVAVKRNGTTR